MSRRARGRAHSRSSRFYPRERGARMRPQRFRVASVRAPPAWLPAVVASGRPVRAYAAQVPFGYDGGEWGETKSKLRAALIAKARARSVVPYSEIVHHLGPIRFDPHDPPFHRMLDEVSRDEDANGRGLLTVIVVHKDGDMRPGPGFFELAKSRGRDGAEIDATWLAELDRVWGYWKDH